MPEGTHAHRFLEDVLPAGVGPAHLERRVIALEAAVELAPPCDLFAARKDEPAVVLGVVTDAAGIEHRKGNMLELQLRLTPPRALRTEVRRGLFQVEERTGAIPELLVDQTQTVLNQRHAGVDLEGPFEMGLGSREISPLLCDVRSCQCEPWVLRLALLGTRQRLVGTLEIALRPLLARPRQERIAGATLEAGPGLKAAPAGHRGERQRQTCLYLG